MKLSTSTTETSPVPRAALRTFLHTHQLDIMRAVWIAVTVLALALFVAGIPARADRLLNLPTEYQRPLRQLGLSPNFYAVYITSLDLTIVLAHLAIAATIFWRKSDDWMALFVSLSLVTLPLSVTNALGTGQAPWPLLVGAVNYLAVVSAVTLLYLFPSGRFVPRWTQPMALIWAVLNLPAVFFPTVPLSFMTWSPPLQALVLLGGVGSGIYAQIHRYTRVSSPLQREQTRWAVFGLGAAALGPVGYFVPFVTLPSLSQPSLPTLFYQLAGPTFFTLSLFYRLVGFTLFTLILLLFPLSFAVAILRYRLWDIQILVNRTLVYGMLTGLVVGLYVLVVGMLGALFQVQRSLIVSILATGLVAVLFQPLRSRLQQSVNRFMYGERDDPVTVLSRLGQQLEVTVATEAVLPTIVGTVVQALHLPYAAVALKQDDAFKVVAAEGQPGDDAVALPLIYQGATIGRLLVRPRAPGEAFTLADRRLLLTIALQAGPAVHAVRLTADLQRSRERLVTTREEERRRLRRDLHDGLGPQLASLTLKLDAARNLLAHNPAAADRLLVELKAQTQAAIGDIRRLVYDLRPPALDELGLVSALRQYAARNSVNGLHVSVQAPEALPPLPAAVEVAAYRIALEALTNVARHARAHTCVIRLAVDEALHVEITDDGDGLPENYQAGVGMMSMRERALELGGECVIESMPAGGTRVSARLPLVRER